MRGNLSMSKDLKCECCKIILMLKDEKLLTAYRELYRIVHKTEATDTLYKTTQCEVIRPDKRMTWQVIEQIK